MGSHRFTRLTNGFSKKLDSHIRAGVLIPRAGEIRKRPRFAPRNRGRQLPARGLGGDTAGSLN